MHDLRNVSKLVKFIMRADGINIITNRKNLDKVKTNIIYKLKILSI
jgi:hypothetical protein